jgi:hypothetical protein
MGPKGEPDTKTKWPSTVGRKINSIQLKDFAMTVLDLLTIPLSAESLSGKKSGN